jgi:hypothetical protein
MSAPLSPRRDPNNTVWVLDTGAGGLVRVRTG